MNPKVFGEGICSLPSGGFIRMTWKDNIIDILDTYLKVVKSIQMF